MKKKYQNSAFQLIDKLVKDPRHPVTPTFYESMSFSSRTHDKNPHLKVI